MKCPKCGSDNFNRVVPRRRYRLFICKDCGYTDTFEPYGNKSKVKGEK